MVSFTAYANKKFDTLRRHGCVISRAVVEEAVRSATGGEPRDRTFFFAQKADENGQEVRVAYRKEAGVLRIITFYPAARNE